MRKLHPLMLGGTLFSPATHPNLLKILQREKLPQLRSIVIDLEDALLANEQSNALQKLQNILEAFSQSDLIVFVRPASVLMLETILDFPSIQKVDGFILPKFSLHNATAYLSLLEEKPFFIMPSIESLDMFDPFALQELRLLLDKYKRQILLIRIGCEDMFSHLGLKRQRGESVFDRGVSSAVMYDIIKTFKPYGYAISGCVFPHFIDNKGFTEDIKRDFLEGLISKTIIHPNQIAPLEALYKVTKEEFESAKRLLKSTEAVYNEEGMMAEKHTQSEYAKEVLFRASLYGVKEF